MALRTTPSQNGCQLQRTVRCLTASPGTSFAKSEIRIERRQTDAKLVDGYDGSFGLCLYCCPSQKGRKVHARARREPRHWIKQELVAFPSYRCSQCNRKHFEGMVECPGCQTRFVVPTDLSVIAEPDRLRRSAARAGRQVNIIDLQPSRGLHRQRVRATGDEEADRVQSTASVRSVQRCSTNRTEPRS